MCQAEVKIRKFRESSACNDGGNPEPSPVKREGAETKHGLCLKCNGQISSDKYRSAKYCSIRCNNAARSLAHRIRKGLIKKPGTGSGGNQWGTDNHMYRTGIGTFSKRAFQYYGRKCNRCGSLEKLVVHHQDEDRTNNVLENLEVLCRKCHQNHHCKRDVSTGKFISQT
jgi:hypothetical protein